MSALKFIFDEDTYLNARRSRLDCLYESFPRENFFGKRVLELGCGTGELGAELERLGAIVTSVEAVPSFVEALKQRYPKRSFHHADLETFEGTEFGHFDIVFSFGLLYHIKHAKELMIASMRAADTVILETVVCDRIEPVCIVVGEDGPDQAFSGSGSRMSPQWIRHMATTAGFRATDISTTKANWDGDPPSRFDWAVRNNWEWLRDGVLLRKMFLIERIAG